MRQQRVMGNWKMNGTMQTLVPLLNELKKGLIHSEQAAQVVVFPSAPYLSIVQNLLMETAIQWGAQNVSEHSQGAYTGECSAAMLADFKCRYVLVGHSERRHFFGETLELVSKKFHHAKKCGMIPVLCIGETLKERERGQTKAILRDQLSSVFLDPMHDFEACVLAYEPVWAIGTGRTATPEQAEEIHAYVRQMIEDYSPMHAKTVSIVYGGSVSSKNAEALFSMPNIDGGLVGGASLDASQFLEIVSCIKSS